MLSKMTEEKFRTEHDAFGEVNVPADKYFGIRTQRARLNFPIGGDRERLPKPLISALGIIKKAAALTNTQFGLSPQLSEAIVKAADEVISGQLYDRGHFPLSIWQSGSGTLSDVNVNEVISNRAIELLGGELGSKNPVHPDEHVNMNQSAHDVFPTASHISVAIEINNNLLPALIDLRSALRSKQKYFVDVVKVGRTHLQDTTAMTLGQEFSVYVQQLSNALKRLECCLPRIYELALGGVAVGTILSSNAAFSEHCVIKIRELTTLPFHAAPNYFEALATRDAMVEMHGVMNSTATSLMKIANDLQLMSSGPRSGLGELTLPETDSPPTSDPSSMPGKVLPTQCEMLAMVCAQVIGNQTAVTVGGSAGQLELNCFQPMIASNVLRSIILIADASRSFTRKCVLGLKANMPRIERLLNESFVLMAPLAQEIGRNEATRISTNAHKNGTSLKFEALKSGLINEKDFLSLSSPKEGSRKQSINSNQ